MKLTYNAPGLQSPLTWSEWILMVFVFFMLIVAGWIIVRFFKMLFRPHIIKGGEEEMKENIICYDDGHNYGILTYMSKGVDHTLIGGTTAVVDSLRFYEMKPDGEKINGVTTEDVLEVLIDRTEKMNAKVSCDENVKALEHLRGALFWLEWRKPPKMKERREE